MSSTVTAFFAAGDLAGDGAARFGLDFDAAVEAAVPGSS
jgi:hypothetical protein